MLQLLDVEKHEETAEISANFLIENASDWEMKPPQSLNKESALLWRINAARLAKMGTEEVRNFQRIFFFLTEFFFF